MRRTSSSKEEGPRLNRGLLRKEGGRASAKPRRTVAEGRGKAEAKPKRTVAEKGGTLVKFKNKILR